MIIEQDTYLEHFGTKGMRWGVRKAERGGVSRGTDRAARKDAEEFARAKLFYGEGAGTRRKLIKNTVEAKSSRDPSYKKSFDRHLNNQNLSTHATKAKRERGRKDFKEKNTKRAGFLARRFTGEMGTQAAFTAVAVGGVAFLGSPRGQQFMKSTYSKTSGFASSITKEVARRRGAARVASMLRSMA